MAQFNVVGGIVELCLVYGYPQRSSHGGLLEVLHRRATLTKERRGKYHTVEAVTPEVGTEILAAVVDEPLTEEMVVEMGIVVTQ